MGYNRLSKGRVLFSEAQMDAMGVPRYSTADITGTTGAGKAAAWANPYPGQIVVLSAGVNVTVTSSASATIDVGTAANATTTSDNLVDGGDLTALGAIGASGTNGQTVGVVAEDGYVTATIAGDVGSPACAGKLYVLWCPATPGT